MVMQSVEQPEEGSKEVREMGAQDPRGSPAEVEGVPVQARRPDAAARDEGGRC